MELELGLKITHTRDDITSHTDLRIDKNYAGPLFLSRETDAVFFLIAYLKGFRRENIDININKDGDRIAISGKKAVQEMVLSGWIMQRKDVELRAFRKVFRIPDGIILDRIKAKFNDEESTLTVIMPKSMKGMRRLEIEEVKEIGTEGEFKKMEGIEQTVPKEIERSEPEIARISPYEDDKKQAKKQDIEHETGRKEESDQGWIESTKAEAVVSETDSENKEGTGRAEEKKEYEEEFKKPVTKGPKETEKGPLSKAEDSIVSKVDDKKQSPAAETRNKDLVDSNSTKSTHKVAPPTRSQQEQAMKNEIKQESQHQEPRKPEPVQAEMTCPEDHGTGNEIKEVEEQEPVEVEKLKDLNKQANKTEVRAVKKRTKLRQPIVVAGSAILVSLIVLVINFIRAKRR